MTAAADVTVVIPSRNGLTRGFLVPCLDSVLAQTQPVARILLVIDEGNTDDTVASLARSHPRAEVLTKPGKGLAAARNYGIRHVTTRYVALLDDDDEFVPEKIARLCAYLDGHPEVGMVFSAMDIVDAEGRHQRRARSSAVGLTYPESLCGNDFMPPSAAVFRQEALLAAGLFDETLAECEDYEFFIRVSRVTHVAYVDEPLTRYRSHQGQMTYSLRQLDDAALRVVRRHARAEQPERADAIIRFYCYGACVRALLRRDFVYARTMLRDAGPKVRVGELLLRAVGVALKPLAPLKVRWRRFEQRLVLGTRGG